MVTSGEGRPEERAAALLNSMQEVLDMAMVAHPDDEKIAGRVAELQADLEVLAAETPLESMGGEEKGLMLSRMTTLRDLVVLAIALLSDRGTVLTTEMS